VRAVTEHPASHRANGQLGILGIVRNFGGFSAKNGLGISILKSGLFLVWIGSPAGNKNPPVGKDTRIRK
jgi:hypothetical protein